MNYDHLVGLPKSFGKEAKSNDITEEFSRTKRAFVKKEEGASNEATSDSDSSDEDSFPISHEVKLKQHTKAVSTVAFDRSGNRFVSGSYDHSVKYWDFNGLSDRSHFREIEPFEHHHIHHLEYGSNDTVLIIPAGAQAKICDREGSEVYETRLGDMYLVNLKNTSGHAAEITCGSWIPGRKEEFYTAGADGTLRIWDINKRQRQKELFIYKSKAGASKVRLTACSTSPDGGVISVSAIDGSIALFGTKGPFNRPVGMVQNAYEQNSITTGLVFAQDSTTIVSRNAAGTVHLWDTRQLSKPQLSRNGLVANHAESTLTCSPDGRFILAPTEDGHLHFLDRTDLSSSSDTKLSNDPLICAEWHEKLGQILCGAADGSIHILYSPELSHRGIIDVLQRKKKALNIDDIATQTTNTNPVDPEFMTNSGAVSQKYWTTQKNLDRKDPVKSRKPDQEKSIRGPDLAKVGDPEILRMVRNQDPREQVLQYAEVAKSDPLFTSAYQATQPEVIFSEEVEEIDNNQGQRKRKFDKLEPFK